MTARKNAEIAAQVLREVLRASTTSDGPPPSAETREQAIAAIRGAIVLRRKRILRTRIAAGVSALAFAASIAFFVAMQRPPLAPAVSAHLVSGDVNVTRAGASPSSPSALTTNDAVAGGTILTTTTAANAVFDYTDGTRLTLGGNAELSVVESGPRRVYSLERGAVDLRVTKLHDGQRLLVRTRDAEIEVHGTQFRVEIADPRTSCDHGATRVVVTEGVVSVRRDRIEARVPAGETWPSCATAVTAIAAPETSAMLVPPVASAQSGQSGPPGLSTPPMTNVPTPAGKPRASASQIGGGSVESSTLEEQNNLFADGIDKKRGGDQAGAVRAFEKLLAQYPNGALAENAAVERFKILRVTDPARAKRAADEYLARWPSGFAREEAKAIADHREK